MYDWLENPGLILLLHPFNGAVFQDEGKLRHCKNDRERHESKEFEINPERLALCPPDKFVERSAEEEKEPPANSQLIPGPYGQFKYVPKHKFDDVLFGKNSADDRQTKNNIDNGRLDIEKSWVFE